VKARLKAPATARFSGETVEHTAGYDGVTGDVDAQNSFGALIRSHYTCHAWVDGGAWHVGTVEVTEAG
jgi:hypothetical protein